MPRNGGGTADTGSPPMTPTPRAIRASEPLYGPASASASARGGAWAGHAPLTTQQREEWRAWLYDMLRKKGWITVLPSGQETRHVGAFGEAARLGDTKEHSANAAQQILRRGSVPETWRIINMARVLGVSPLAMLYRAYQITFEQLAALIGPTARVLVTKAETQASIDALRQMPGLPESYRQQFEHRFTEDYRYSVELREQLALSETEFEQFRAFLSERGREQTRRDVLADETPLAPLADPEAEPREQVFAQPLASPITTVPFTPESALEPPAAQAPHRRPPADSPVWREEDDGVDDSTDRD